MILLDFASEGYPRIFFQPQKKRKTCLHWCWRVQGLGYLPGVRGQSMGFVWSVTTLGCIEYINIIQYIYYVYTHVFFTYIYISYIYLHTMYIHQSISIHPQVLDSFPDPSFSSHAHWKFFVCVFQHVFFWGAFRNIIKVVETNDHGMMTPWHLGEIIHWTMGAMGGW